MERRPVFNPPMMPQQGAVPERVAPVAPPRRRGRWLTLMVSLAALVSFGGVVYWAHEQDLKSGGEGIIPLIRADDKPSKVKPTTPGGMVVPDQDKTVYDRIAPGSVPSGPEKLLPPPPIPQIPPATPPQAMPTVTPPAPPTPAPAPQTADSSAPPAAPAVPPPAAAPSTPATPPASALASPPASPPASPVATPAAPPAPAPAAAPPGSAAQGGQSIASLIDNISGYRIQLASVRSEEQAQATWARMQKSNGDVLSSLTMRAVKVDLGERGIYYRVQAGPLDADGAQAACNKLKGRSIDCIVVKP